MQKIIALIGEKFSGKDVVANYLVGRYGAAHVRFSHVLDDILKILDLSISRRNEIALGLGLRKIFGDGVLGHAIEKRVADAKSGLVVVNGVRMDEMKNVKNLGAKTVYVTAPIEIRFQRYLNRHEKADDASMGWKEFIAQEQEPTEKDIPRLGKQCGFKIENTGTVEELYGKVDRIIDKIDMIEQE